MRISLFDLIFDEVLVIMRDQLDNNVYPSIKESLAEKYKLKYVDGRICYPTTELVDIIDTFLSNSSEKYNLRSEDIDKFRNILMNDIFNRMQSKLRFFISIDENGNIYMDEKDVDVDIDEEALKLEIANFIDEEKIYNHTISIPDDTVADICDNINIYDIVESFRLEEFHNMIKETIDYYKGNGQLMLEFSMRFLIEKLNKEDDCENEMVISV
ncbi:MAG: hypothetical protein QW478_11520 [Candidatus Micrarchaeaceae archaeon]